MKTGYIYALQPIGMTVVKIGCTSSPLVRADQIGSFAPVPMVFRHLLDVGSINTARAFEQDVLGWSSASKGHGEWRHDLALVDDLFECVAPAVDVSSQFHIPVKATNRGSRMHPEQLEQRLILAAYYDRFPGGIYPAQRAAGLNHCAALATSKTVERARQWLADNPYTQIEAS